MSDAEDHENDPVQKALRALKPRTVAAQLRGHLPAIDEKIQAGARLEEILTALASAGLSVKPNTLKSYLQRYRKSKQTAREKKAAPAAKPEAPSLHQIMRPDSESQDADMANYERIGKQNLMKNLQNKTHKEE